MSGKNADPRRKHNGSYRNKSPAAFYVKVEVVDIATFLMRLLDAPQRCGSAWSHDLPQCFRRGFVSCAGAFLLRRLHGLHERAVRGLYDAAAGAHSLEDSKIQHPLPPSRRPRCNAIAFTFSVFVALSGPQPLS